MRDQDEPSVVLAPATGFSGVLDARPAQLIPTIRGWRGLFPAIVRKALATPAGEEIRIRSCAQIAVETVVQVATVDAETGDGAGKDIQTSHATCAKRLSQHYRRRISEATVKKARKCLRLLGLATITEEGRHLTRTERLKQQLAGRVRPFWRKAATRALTLPKEWVTMAGDVRRKHKEKTVSSPLPRRGLKTPLTHLKDTYQKRAQARTWQRQNKNQPKRSAEPRRYTLGMYRLAAHLEYLLGRSPNPRRLGQLDGKKRPHQHHWLHLLDRYRVSEATHTQQDLTDIFNKVLAQQSQYGWYSPRTINNPLGYATWTLHQARSLNLLNRGTVTTARKRQEQLRAEATQARERREAVAAWRKKQQLHGNSPTKTAALNTIQAILTKRAAV